MEAISAAPCLSELPFLLRHIAAQRSHDRFQALAIDGATASG
jgi:hypothetical protein